MLVGVWNTVFGYSIFVLLDELFSSLFRTRQIAYMAAMILSNVVAVLNAFVFHKHVTFRSRVRGLAMLSELFRFSATYLLTFCLSVLLLPLFVEVFHFSPKVAGAFVVLICTVVSYLGHSRFSFRKTSS